MGLGNVALIQALSTLHLLLSNLSTTFLCEGYVPAASLGAISACEKAGPQPAGEGFDTLDRTCSPYL